MISIFHLLPPLYTHTHGVPNLLSTPNSSTANQEIWLCDVSGKLVKREECLQLQHHNFTQDKNVLLPST